MASIIFTFETTHHALWAEEIARELGIAFEITAPPSGANARCDIALATFREDRELLERALTRWGIEARIFEADGTALPPG